jgi:4-amino-4-deoxy-L-arabinose transferase-like glycosyltransferase
MVLEGPLHAQRPLQSHRAAASVSATPRAHAGWWPALAAICIAGAALRFSTLSLQSFWLDEAVTHDLVTRPLGAMLRALPHSESTPPLYYLVAWVWVRIFGSGEAGLRSLSALLGTATIVVVALLARRLAGDRAGLAAAALTAANPLLIWYSQEARAYSQLVLMSALTLWLLAEERWDLWALAAILALATHYFAVFVVGPELGWILWRYGRESRAARAAVAATLVAGVALAPLAIVQASGNRAAFIHSSSLASRAVAVPKQFLIGYRTPHATVLTVVAALLVLGLAFSLRRRDRTLLGLVAFGVGVPLALAVVGTDYLITRNVMAALVPLLVVAGAASARSRAGPALIAGICALGIVAYAGVEGNGGYQRDDWRGVAKALGPPPAGGLRVVLVNPASGALPLELYRPALRSLSLAGLSPFAVDVVAMRGTHPPAVPKPFPDFTATTDVTPGFTIIRYRSPVSIGLSKPQLDLLNFNQAAAQILYDGCCIPGQPGPGAAS